MRERARSRVTILTVSRSCIGGATRENVVGGAGPGPSELSVCLYGHHQSAINMSAAASGVASVRLPLLELPNELLLLVPRSLLARGRWHDALRLLEACTALHARLAPVRQEAAAEAAKRRLRWVEVKATGETAIYEVSNEGRTLRKLVTGYRWAVGDKPLPTVGTSSWRVRVDESWRNGALVIGALVIGVCDAMRRRARVRKALPRLAQRRSVARNARCWMPRSSPMGELPSTS
mgnify:CR=1 FL=1